MERVPPPVQWGALEIYPSGARANGQVAKGTWRLRPMKFANAAHHQIKNVGLSFCHLKSIFASQKSFRPPLNITKM